MSALSKTAVFHDRDRVDHDRVITRLLPQGNVPVDVTVHVPEPPKILYGVVHRLGDQSGSSAILARLQRVAGQLQRAFIA
jgi:hypothetical protein